MDLRREDIEKISATYTAVEFIKDKIAEGDEISKDHGERILTLEKNQQYMAGKIAVIVTIIGMIVLFLSNIIFKWLWK